MQADVDSDWCRILLGYVPWVLALGFGAIANAKNRSQGPTGLGYLTPYMALASSKDPASSTAAPDWVCPYQEMAFVSPYLSAVSIHVQPCLGSWMHAAPVSDVKYHSILRYYSLSKHMKLLLSVTRYVCQFCFHVFLFTFCFFSIHRLTPLSHSLPSQLATLHSRCNQYAILNAYGNYLWCSAAWCQVCRPPCHVQCHRLWSWDELWRFFTKCSVVDRQ